MNPDKKKQQQLRLSQLFQDSGLIVCPGLNEDAPIKTGVVSKDYIDQLFVDDDDKQVGYKSFLGRTIARSFGGNSSIGTRVARSMGVVVDELGKLRCPPGTPNANQFTDLQMTGCFDVVPGPQGLVNGVVGVPDFQMHGLALRRRETILERALRITDKYGQLDTIAQQTAALGKAFPHANISFKDRFLNRITPGGRRKIQTARKAFVVGLLAEADEFPEVASGISHISDRLGLVGGRGTHAMTGTWGNGIEIHMSQWGATSIGERISRAAERSTIKKSDKPLSTLMSNGLSTDSPADEYWHHVAVHEFGHAIDMHNIFDSLGFEPKGVGRELDYHKVKPASDSAIEKQLLDALKDATDENGQIDFKKFGKELMQIFEKLFTDRKLDDNEIEMLDSLLGSAYAAVNNKNPGIHEYIAELFAQVRISGYGSEIDRSVGDIKIRSPREILRQTLQRDIPGSDDAAGGRQIGEFDKKAVNSNPEEKGMGRRLKRRIEKFIPRSLRIDGDGDGKVRNPITGADDVPMIRGQQTRLDVQARNFANIRREQNSRRGLPKVFMKPYRDDNEDNDPDELMRRLGIDPSKPSRHLDRWGVSASPKIPDQPVQQQSEPNEVRRLKVSNFKYQTMLRLNDELMDLVKELHKKRDPEDVNARSDDDSGVPNFERNYRRLNKLSLRLSQMLKDDLIRQNGSDVEMDLTEVNLKRFLKGLSSLKSMRSDLNDEYEIINSKLIDDLYKALPGQFVSLDKIMKKTLNSDQIEFKAVFGRRARRAIRKIIRKPDFDGDGDGFITNPRTGKDDLPFIGKPDLPEIDKPRKRSLFESMLSRGQTLPRVRSLAPEWESANPDAASDTSWAGRLRATMKQHLENDQIKTRPWGPMAIRFAEIQSKLDTRYGKLETAKDFQNAFKTALPGVKVRFYDSDDKRLGDDAFGDLVFRGEMLGMLYMIDQMPDHWKHARKLSIYRTADQGGSSSGSVVGPKMMLRHTPGTPVNLNTGDARLDIGYISGYGILDANGGHISIEKRDSVPSQIAKAYLKHIKDSNAVGEGIITAEDAYKTAALLESIGVGVHESGHIAHFTRASLLTGKETPAMIQKMIDDALADHGDDIKTAAIREFASKTIDDGIENIVHALTMFGTPENLYDVAQGPATTPEELQLKFTAMSIVNKLSENPLTATGALQNYLFSMSDDDSEVRQQLRRIAFSGYSTDQLAKLAWGPDGKSDAMQEIFEEMIDIANKTYRDDGTPLVSETISWIYDNIVLRDDNIQATALRDILQSRMWDDLSEKEIQVLRNAWKYISSYAKDKNSFYLDTTGISRPSIEGVAEAMVARIFGFTFIKDKPEAEAALDKLFKWIFTAPEPAIALEFDKLIESIGDIDLGPDEGKSLYRGLDGASKDLYLLLGLEEPI